MQAGYRSDVGRVRESNEDTLWCGEHLFVVADGMGGHAAGEVASNLAVQTVTGWRFPPETAPIHVLKDEVGRAVQAANQEVYDRARREPSMRGMGTTLTLAIVSASVAVLGHVGDSRAYIVRKGHLRQITEDHSVVWELVRSGGISETQAQQHPYRNLLTRSLGTSRQVDVDVSRIPLLPGDGLLLCTDGLSGVLSDEEIAKEAVSGKDPQEVVDAMIEEVLSRGAPDNVSVILVFPESKGE